MKKSLLFLFLLVAILSMSACSDEPDPDVIKISKSSDEIVGENYKTVISELKETGFTNIKTKVLDDLITGFLTKDGEIEQVEINGDTEFSVDDSFQKDSKIVITYHTFPKREKDTKTTDEKSAKAETRPTDEKSAKTDTNSTDEKNSKSDTSSTNEKSSETAKQSTNDKPKKSKQEILTVNNNEDLAAVLAVKNEADPIIGEFAKKYAGRTIEFDGNITNMMPHKSYKTSYDILILAGYYSETTFSGPNFKFEDVNVSDLNLTGSDIPESIGMGQNLHITAKVGEYNETSQLFFLKPITTVIR
ncbi:DUF4839 domain-containing protein [Neobacillus niacini]|uniref:DUF4839 domain-containing protein n=1 Tax=Neobacillus niacini TaxID=86668 RepID=UPI002FFEC720